MASDARLVGAGEALLYTALSGGALAVLASPYLVHAVGDAGTWGSTGRRVSLALSVSWFVFLLAATVMYTFTLDTCDRETVDPVVCDAFVRDIAGADQSSAVALAVVFGVYTTLLAPDSRANVTLILFGMWATGVSLFPVTARGVSSAARVAVVAVCATVATTAFTCTHVLRVGALVVRTDAGATGTVYGDTHWLRDAFLVATLVATNSAAWLAYYNGTGAGAWRALLEGDVSRTWSAFVPGAALGLATATLRPHAVRFCCCAGDADGDADSGGDGDWSLRALLLRLHHRGAKPRRRMQTAFAPA
jgi:hypothetical protein